MLYHLSNVLSLNCGKQHLYLALFKLRDTRWSVQDVQYLYFSLVLLPILLIPSLFCILVWLLCLTLFHVLLCFCYFVSLIVQRSSVHKALLFSQLHLCHRFLGDLISYVSVLMYPVCRTSTSCLWGDCALWGVLMTCHRVFQSGTPILTAVRGMSCSHL